MKAIYALLLIAILLISTSCASQSGPAESDPASTTTGDDSQGEVTYTQDEEIYLFFRAEAQNNLNSAFSDLENLMNNPLNTDEWEAEMSRVITHIYSICDAIQSTYVPDRFALSHYYLEFAAEDYSLAMDYLLLSLPELVKERLQEGDANWAEANRLLE